MIESKNIVNDAFDNFTKLDLFLALDEFLNPPLQGDTVGNMFEGVED